ncbi:MAG: hypothetical protein JWN44_5360 [Myxococcales bacterium]|nr:hypothetical protein [Myxococcales bacterium]
MLVLAAMGLSASGCTLVFGNDLNKKHEDNGGGGGSGGGGTTAPCTVSGTNHTKLVITSVTLPIQRTDYSLDLNGDGRTDNQYAALVGALTGQGLNSQMTINAAVRAGTALQLIDLVSSDTAFMSDACAGASLQAAVSQSSPDFSGHGVFTVDGQKAPAAYSGSLVTGTFSSTPVATSTSSVELPFQLAIGTTMAVAPLVATHIQYTLAPNGLMTGQLNGAMRSVDVQTFLIPAIAAGYQAQANDNPSSANTMQLRAIFDTGGGGDGSGCQTTGGQPACRNPSYGPRANQCADARDAIFDLCELSNSNLLKNLLAADVQLFAADGVTFAPDRGNAMKDSVSVGVGFTAFGASF